jgi:hypothetical protein
MQTMKGTYKFTKNLLFANQASPTMQTSPEGTSCNLKLTAWQASFENQELC